jgi:hypothetical protein
MIVYYAHCLAIYDTPQEMRDVFLLESLGFSVENPNTSAVTAECAQVRENARRWNIENPNEPLDLSQHVMEQVFHKRVRACHVLAFRALPGGRIPAGVAQEVEWAREAGIPVIELPTNVIGRGMSVAETREYLHEVGQR